MLFSLDREASKIMRKPIYNTMPSRLGTQLEGITSYRITQRNCSKRKGFFFLTCSCRFLHMKHYSRNWSIDLNIFTIFRVLILKFFSINISFSYTISERFSKTKYVCTVYKHRQTKNNSTTFLGHWNNKNNTEKSYCLQQIQIVQKLALSLNRQVILTYKLSDNFSESYGIALKGKTWPSIFFYWSLEKLNSFQICYSHGFKTKGGPYPIHETRN